MKTLSRTLVILSAAALVASVLAAACYGQGLDAPNLLDLPPELRARNYASGSCLHAAIQDVLRWHGLHTEADQWRRGLWGALGVDRGARIMDRKGFDYAYTVSGDAAFLDWCSRNRHGAAIHYFPGHAVTFRGYAGGYAILQDNNRPSKVIRIEKEAFVRNWKRYGGRAITVVYSPYPPTPRM